MKNKILLADDDAEFRAEFMDCFEEYDIIEASSGEEALKILGKPNEIDLVILDFRMPGINGIEVLNKIRKISADLGIIILTGHSSKDIAIEALRGKADNYIEKPFNIETTRKIIEKVLESKNDTAGYPTGDIKGKIEHVKQFLRRNIFKKVTLKDAASAAGMSPKYLSRVFKEQAKTGFNEYKLSMKIDNAKKLLIETGYNVDQISDKLGYLNTESFIRQFKKITQMTPHEFRKQKKSHSGNFPKVEKSQ